MLRPWFEQERQILITMLTARSSSMRAVHIYERMGDMYVTPRLLGWMLRLLEWKGYIYRLLGEPRFYGLTPAGIEYALWLLHEHERVNP